MPIERFLLVTGGGLQGPLFDAPDAEPRGALEELPAGTAIGSYRITGLLARGGTSLVYRAERCDGAFAHSVALKITYVNPALRDFARRERDILAKLQHPQIARIHDAGETDAGALWFAMELVSGSHVDAYVAEHRLPWDDRIRLLRQVADALGDAHRNLVVHRDIKPSNVLVGQDGTPKLVDFGIASDMAGVAEEGAAACTPAYASPEQLRGELVGATSDVYQLTLLLDELLLPGPRRGEKGIALAEGLRLPKLVRANIATIVAKGTQDDPRERYQSIGELDAELARVIARRPSRNFDSSWGTRAVFFADRHLAMVSVVAAALLGIAIFIVIDGLHVRRARDQAEQAALRAEGSANFLINLISSPEVSTDDATRLAAIALLKHGESRLINTTLYSPVQRAALSLDICRAYEATGNIAASGELVERQYALAQRDLPADSYERAMLARWSGWIAFLQGDYALAAQRNIEAGAGLAPSTDPRRNVARAELMGQRSTLANELGHLAEALVLRKEALRMFAETFGPESPRNATQWLNLGLLELDLRHPDVAVFHLEKALPVYQASWGIAHPWTVRVAFLLAAANNELRNFAAAEALLTPQIESLRKQQPGSAAMLARGLDFLARVRLHQARYIEAQEIAEESILVFRQDLEARHDSKDAHGSLASPLRSLARAELAQGETKTAHAHSLQAFETSRRAFGERHVDVLDTLLELASTRMVLGDLASAKLDLDRALKLSVDLGPDRTNGTASVQVLQAELAILQGDAAAATTLLDRAEPILVANRPGELDWLERVQNLRTRLRL